MSNLKENYKGFINMSTMKWLKTQVWAWILFGIFIMSIFFYIAKGMIVFIGGTFLGLYLYTFPPKICLIIWDLFLFDGIFALVKIIVPILKRF